MKTAFVSRDKVVFLFPAENDCPASRNNVPGQRNHSKISDTNRQNPTKFYLVFPEAGFPSQAAVQNFVAEKRKESLPMAERCTIYVYNEHDIVRARQVGRQIAKEMGFGSIVQARITTAISELARNIFLYAGKGTITIEQIQEEQRIGLRVIAADEGPGIPDIRKAMEDGFSTSGALGAGLPGVKRLMDTFLIESAPNRGTRVTVVKWKD